MKWREWRAAIFMNKDAEKVFPGAFQWLNEPCTEEQNAFLDDILN